jgi:acetyltransferase (GNAT) family protein
MTVEGNDLSYNSRDGRDFLALFDAEQRRDVEYFDSIREATPHVVRHISRFGGEGLIISSDLARTDVASVAREQIAYFKFIGQDFQWKVYDYDEPADLGEQLVGMGFNEAKDKEAVVFLDLSVIPERLADLTNPGARRLVNAEEVDEYVAMLRSIWPEGYPGLAQSLKAQLQEAPSRHEVYVVQVDGVAVSAGRILFPEKGSFAYLGGGITLPAWRNRGLYSSLVAVRTLEAQRRGYRYVTIDARPTSRPILEKLGFRVLTHTRRYEWTALISRPS